MALESKRYFVQQAWIDGAWAADVVLSVDELGMLCSIQKNAPLDLRHDAIALSGAVLPGLVNAHSHAFQRAIAGLTECRATEAIAGADDDFWSWRSRMYSAANRVTPAQLEVIATFLYAELLVGGYTHVCEFHYLHNDLDGKPYADPLEMSMALVRAAQATGIGLTLLPTLYMRAGFGAAGLREDQRRFASCPERVLQIADGIAQQWPNSQRINAGIALHSLRAVGGPAIEEITQQANRQNLAVHLHIAEQMQEVDDCLAHHSQRPIEWLLTHADVKSNWNLVHATHTTAKELAGIQQTGASVVICPSTEANLGDGFFDYRGYAGLGGTWSVGSDSHVTRSWPEELRLLEYSQRLIHRKRNVAASVSTQPSSAAALFESALAGGRAATGLALGGIVIGNRADFLVLDRDASALVGVPLAQQLDALVFSSPTAAFHQVFVAGEQVVRNGRSVGADPAIDLWSELANKFRTVMGELWR